jgi:hypothetical protein
MWRGADWWCDVVQIGNVTWCRLARMFRINLLPPLRGRTFLRKVRQFVLRLVSFSKTLVSFYYSIWSHIIHNSNFTDSVVRTPDLPGIIWSECNYNSEIGSFNSLLILLDCFLFYSGRWSQASPFTGGRKLSHSPVMASFPFHRWSQASPFTGDRKLPISPVIASFSFHGCSQASPFTGGRKLPLSPVIASFPFHWWSQASPFTPTITEGTPARC